MALALAILFSLPAFTQTSSDPATIGGFVTDAHGAPVAGSSISLQMKNGTLNRTVSADSKGAYRFAVVNAGIYSLRAKMAGYDEAIVAACAVASGEVKTVNFRLNPARSSPPDTSKTPAMPEFSDEPNFTVAGVADTTNLGGHGSDVVVRNREGLAKATASLGGVSAATSRTAVSASTEKSLRAALEQDAGSFDSNYRLGRLLVKEGRAGEAIGYLERAAQTRPGVYEYEYELALAQFATGSYDLAEVKTRELLGQQDRAELHHLLAEIGEKRNNPLEAVRQYQRAAELDASEANFFDWGAELLLHQAPEPAIEVFTKGNRLFPSSVRMLAALGAAWYSRGSPDEAVQVLCRASDLDPNAIAPYTFLGRIQIVEAGGNKEVAARLERFARLQPDNALADYYFAVSLWKQRKNSDDNKNLPQIESLLTKAVRLDPKPGAAYLQLGILYSERKNSNAAVAAYQKAVESAPELPDAHYRLAQAYRQTGEKLKAQQQLQLYEQTSKKAADEVERERHEIPQFVYKLRDQSSASRPD